MRVSLGLFFGTVSGVMAGLLGVSGTSPVIAGLYMMGRPAGTVVGTSLLVLLFNAFSGLVGHIRLGHFEPDLAILLSLGVVVGALIGPGLMARAEKETLEKLHGPVYVAVMAALGLAMLLGI